MTITDVINNIISAAFHIATWIALAISLGAAWIITGWLENKSPWQVFWVDVFSGIGGFLLRIAICILLGLLIFWLIFYFFLGHASG